VYADTMTFRFLLFKHSIRRTAWDHWNRYFTGTMPFLLPVNSVRLSEHWMDYTVWFN